MLTFCVYVIYKLTVKPSQTDIIIVILSN